MTIEELIGSVGIRLRAYVDERLREIKEIVGPVGPVGPIGEAGKPGLDGAIGPQGLQGERGEKGDKGDAGINGSPGPQGEQGLQGERGEKGDAGERGRDGRDAISELSFDGKAIDGGRIIRLTILAGQRESIVDIKTAIPVHRHGYKSDQSYEEGDIVTYNGSSWIAISPVDKNSRPPSDKWKLMAQSGKNGERGIEGKPGKDGKNGRDLTGSGLV